MDIKEEKKYIRRLEAFSSRLGELIGGRGHVKPFAKKCGVSDKGVANYLLGKTHPSLDILEKIAEANNVTIAWLIGETDYRTEPRGTLAVNEALPQYHHDDRPPIPLLIEETLRRDQDGTRLLEKTAAVLQSRTAHAGALQSNIEAFYEAVADKRDKEGLRQEAGRLSTQVEALVEKINAIEGKTVAKKVANGAG